MHGAEETPVDRELQSKELARIMAESYPQPVIFLGYVVTKPHAKRQRYRSRWVEPMIVSEVEIWEASSASAATCIAWSQS